MTEAAITALGFALFDARNTSRPVEHPEELVDYIAEARMIAPWIEVHGYTIRKARK